MIDLTAITTPFGLLDKETQDALRAHGGPYEVYMGDTRDASVKWMETAPLWSEALVVRVKPQPPKPREWWVQPDEFLAAQYDGDNAEARARGWVHVREVV